MELGITKGQEAVVYRWQTAVGSCNQLILDTLFVELEKLPKPVKINGLPDNVVPLICNSTSTVCSFTDDSELQILRSQIDVL